MTFNLKIIYGTLKREEKQTGLKVKNGNYLNESWLLWVKWTRKKSTGFLRDQVQCGAKVKGLKKTTKCCCRRTQKCFI